MSARDILLPPLQAILDLHHAAIGFGLGKIRHPFVDRNKRAAWFAMFVTMRLNGIYLDARESDATAIVLGMADRSVSEDDLIAFLVVNGPPRDGAGVAGRSRTC